MKENNELGTWIVIYFALSYNLIILTIYLST